jgi:tetratricopeptide (TPR) repeat protein
MNIPRAMEHLDKAQALVTDQAQLPRLYFFKGTACHRSMETTNGFELTRQAMELSEQLGDEFWWILAAMMNAWFLIALGHFAEAHALEVRARNRAERFEDIFCGSTVAWVGGVNSLVLLDPCAALTKFRTELARPRTSRSPTQSAPLLEWSCLAHAAIGEMAECRRVEARLSGLDSSTDMPRGYKDWDSEHSDFLAKIALARSNGQHEAVCYLTAMLGERCRPRGMYGESEAFLRESLDLASNAPHLPKVVQAESHLCLLYFDMDRREEAHRSLEHCRSILAGEEDWKGIGGLAARAEAVVAALDRKFEDADAQFEKAMDNLRRYRLVWLEADTYYDWGRVLISAGDERRASEKFGAAIEIYRRIGAEQRWIDRVEEARARIGVREVSGERNGAVVTSCSFQREGDFWTISYRSHTFRLKNMKGLHYIAYLLARPGNQFHVHDLVTAVDRLMHADETFQRDSELRVADDLGDAGAILDPRAKAEYRGRLVELRRELAEAEKANDDGRAERIREELEMLEEQLATAVGLGGRDRKAADHAERTRSRVGRAIRTSLKSIRENDPSLGHHLESCIRTGYLCAYHPGPEVSLAWRL